MKKENQVIEEINEKENKLNLCLEKPEVILKLEKLLDKLNIKNDVISEKELNSLKLESNTYDLFCYYLMQKGYSIDTQVADKDDDITNENDNKNSDFLTYYDDYIKQYLNDIGTKKVLSLVRL